MFAPLRDAACIIIPSRMYASAVVVHPPGVTADPTRHHELNRDGEDDLWKNWVTPEEKLEKYRSRDLESPEELVAEVEAHADGGEASAD